MSAFAQSTQARSLRPCIIFMDEIDAVGRTRGGAQVCKTVLNQDCCAAAARFLATGAPPDSTSAHQLVNRCTSSLQGNDERDTTLNQLLSEMDGFGDQGGSGRRALLLCTPRLHPSCDVFLSSSRPGRLL